MLNRVITFAICVTMIFALSSCINQSTPPNVNLPHKCESICNTCGKCKNVSCNEAECKTKCENNHINLPDIDVDDLK